MKSFHVHPEHLERSGGKLGEFGGKLASGGEKLGSSGERLVAHASGDRSGIGGVIAKVFGKGLGITGKVFSEGGRVARGHGERLTGAGHGYRELDEQGSTRFKKLHPEAKTGAPTPSGSSVATHGKSARSGKPGSGIRGRIGNKVRPASIPPKNRTCTKDPVDLATGDVLLTQTDVELPGVLALVLSRTHLSSYREGWSFGPSWACTLDQRLDIDAGGAVFAGSDGVLLVYPALPHDAEPVFAEEGPRWPLLVRDDDLVVEDVDTGELLHFPRPDLADADATVSRLAAISDGSGNRIDVDRDVEGVPVAVRHSGGYHVDVSTTDGRITGFSLRDKGSVADGSFPLRRFGYDERGNLAEVVNGYGLPLRFTYDAAGRLTEWVDRNNMWYRYRYDDSGKCVATDGAGGHLAATISYDTEELVTTETNSLGHDTRYHFNAALQAVRTVDPLGGETTAEFDWYDRLLARTDQLGRTTRFDYTEAGDLTRITRPDGSQIVAEYDTDHLPLTVIEPDGAVWRRAFDAAGNLVAVTDPAGSTTRYRYTERGHLVEEVDPLGAQTIIDCDDAGLPVRITDPLGAQRRYQRDAFGRVTALTEPDGSVTRLAWTVDGQLRERIGPDGSSERWTYDGEGNRVSYVDELGQVSTTEYAGFDLPVAEVDPTGARTELAYDTESQLISVTMPGDLGWRFAYDAAGHLVGETDLNGRTLTHTRDLAGQTVATTNALGQTTGITHDVLGRPTEIRAVDGTTFYTYDEADRVVRATNGDADLQVRRDALGRIVAETCNGRTVASWFDAAGRRTRRVTPTGAIADFQYDPAGRLHELRTAGNRLTFGYDAVGRETSRRFGAATLTQTWAGHRLHTQTLTGSPAAGGAQPVPLQRRAYTYREDGALVGVVDGLTGVRRYELDPVGRATAVEGPGTSERYGYDAMGRVTRANWPSPASPGRPMVGETPAAQGDRAYTGTLLRSAGRVRYEHDAQGRLVARHARSLSGGVRTWRYTWNSDDRLVAVLTPDAVHWRYLYDALGRRIAKIRLSMDGTVAERIDFAWDGLNLAEQTQSTGHAITWSYEPDGVTPLCQVERVRGPSRPQVPNAPATDPRSAPQEWIDQRFYGIVADLTGSPAELVDARGGITWSGFATLWGEPLLAGAQPAACPLRFPGQYHDAETDEHYNLHRYYSPTTAGFLTSDPLGVTGGANPHGYVDNPTGWVDPLGLTPCQLSKDLKGWKRKQYQFGPHQLTLERDGLKHILTRHHPKYWDGSVKAQQSFFPKNTTVPQIEHNISEVLKQNRDTLVRRGTGGMYQLRGTVNGKDYVLGINKGHIGQFYPV